MKWTSQHIMINMIINSSTYERLWKLRTTTHFSQVESTTVSNDRFIAFTNCFTKISKITRRFSTYFILHSEVYTSHLVSHSIWTWQNGSYFLGVHAGIGVLNISAYSAALSCILINDPFPCWNVSNSYVIFLYFISEPY